MKMKKTLSILLVLAMVFAFAACNTNDSESESESSKTNSGDNQETKDSSSSADKEDKFAEKVEIKWFIPSDPGRPFSSDLFIFKEMGKQVNANIIVESPPRDAFQEKFAATMATGKILDIITFFKDEISYMEYGPKKFESLNPYLEDGTLASYKRYLDKYPDVVDKMSHPDDGNIYGFGLLNAVDLAQFIWYIDNEQLNAAGWKTEDIKTMDDFKAAMLALKKESGLPYITGHRLGWNYFIDAVGKYFGIGPSMNDNGIRYDNALADGSSSKTFKLSASTEQFKEFVEFTKWMVDNEIINPIFLSMQKDELFSKYADGSFPLMMEQTSMYKNIDPKFDKDIGAILPLKINGKKYAQPLAPHYNINYRTPSVVSKDSKVKERCMGIFGWMYSDEGYLTLTRGIEGEDWVADETWPAGFYAINTQGKYEQMRVEKGEITKEQYDALPKAWITMGLGNFWTRGVIDESQTFQFHSFVPGETEKSKIIKDFNQKLIDGGYTSKPEPVVKFNKEEASAIANIMTPCKTYMDEQAVKFIFGERDMSEWNDFLKELEKLGYKEVEDMYNAKIGK